MKKEIKDKVANKRNIKSSLLDAHRKTPRTEGGKYTPENTEVLTPREHLEEHGNLREREEGIEELKTLIDGREHLMKTMNGSNNRVLAIERNVDKLDEPTIEFLKENAKLLKSQIGKQNRRIKKHLKSMNMPIIDAAIGVRGIGEITVAYILAYVDINKARYASSVWAYVGYDKASHERKQKGVSGGGNQNLRTQLFATSGSIIKSKGTANPCLYAEIYVNAKRDYEVSNKITKTRVAGKTGNHEMAWKDVAPLHRHHASIRKMMKHYLADFWYVWRTLEGLETPMLYPEAKLGHTGIVKPEERGWVFEERKEIKIKVAKKSKAKVNITKKKITSK